MATLRGPSRFNGLGLGSSSSSPQKSRQDRSVSPESPMQSTAALAIGVKRRESNSFKQLTNGNLVSNSPFQRLNAGSSSSSSPAVAPKVSPNVLRKIAPHAGSRIPSPTTNRTTARKASGDENALPTSTSTGSLASDKAEDSPETIRFRPNKPSLSTSVPAPSAAAQGEASPTSSRGLFRPVPPPIAGRDSPESQKRIAGLASKAAVSSSPFMMARGNTNDGTSSSSSVGAAGGGTSTLPQRRAELAAKQDLPPPKIAGMGALGVRAGAGPGERKVGGVSTALPPTPPSARAASPAPAASSTLAVGTTTTSAPSRPYHSDASPAKKVAFAPMAEYLEYTVDDEERRRLSGASTSSRSESEGDGSVLSDEDDSQVEASFDHMRRSLSEEANLTADYSYDADGSIVHNHHSSDFPRSSTGRFSRNATPMDDEDNESAVSVASSGMEDIFGAIDGLLDEGEGMDDERSEEDADRTMEAPQEQEQDEEDSRMYLPTPAGPSSPQINGYQNTTSSNTLLRAPPSAFSVSDDARSESAYTEMEDEEVPPTPTPATFSAAQALAGLGVSTPIFKDDLFSPSSSSAHYTLDGHLPTASRPAPAPPASEGMMSKSASQYSLPEVNSSPFVAFADEEAGSVVSLAPEVKDQLLASMPLQMQHWNSNRSQQQQGGEPEHLSRQASVISNANSSVVSTDSSTFSVTKDKLAAIRKRQAMKSPTQASNFDPLSPILRQFGDTPASKTISSAIPPRTIPQVVSARPPAKPTAATLSTSMLPTIQAGRELTVGEPITSDVAKGMESGLDRLAKGAEESRKSSDSRPARRRSLSTGDVNVAETVSMQKNATMPEYGLPSRVAAFDAGDLQPLQRTINNIYSQHVNGYTTNERQLGSVRRKNADEVTTAPGAGDVMQGRVAIRRRQRPSTVQEHKQEIEAFRKTEKPGKPTERLFVTLLEVRMPSTFLPQAETSFVIQLDNKRQKVDTKPYKMASIAPIKQEFELICHPKLEFSFSLRTPVDTTINRHLLPPAPVTPSSPGKSSPFKNLLRSPKKAPKPPAADPFLQLLGPQGVFATAAVALEDVKDKCMAKASLLELPLPPIKGALRLQLLFLPTIPGIDPKELPRSADECKAGIARAEREARESHEGRLTQLGGDCNYWRERLFKLEGGQLTPSNLITKKAYVEFDLSLCNGLEDLNAVQDRRANNRSNSDDEGEPIYEHSFRLYFQDGTEITLRADTADSKALWMTKLRNVAGAANGQRAPIWANKLVRLLRETAKTPPQP